MVEYLGHFAEITFSEQKYNKKSHFQYIFVFSYVRKQAVLCLIHDETDHNAVLIEDRLHLRKIQINLVFHWICTIFAVVFEENIEEYESIRQEYQQKIADRMDVLLT